MNNNALICCVLFWSKIVMQLVMHPLQLQNFDPQK